MVESRRETVHRLLLWLLQGVCVWGVARPGGEPHTVSAFCQALACPLNAPHQAVGGRRAAMPRMK